MLLQLQQITKSYLSGSKSPGRLILDQLDLQVAEGESIAITGPSGSGKTTLLNLVGTLDRPDSGRILFGNSDLSEMDDRQLAIFRNEKIGFVFQQHFIHSGSLNFDDRTGFLGIPEIGRLTKSSVQLQAFRIANGGIPPKIDHWNFMKTQLES